ncbi:hypothetical protein pVco7_gp118 [Vibrio phage pVco-7]|uniref:Tape measure protein n=1 Tax=Vibrio phage pVco-5 TaxID=1965485 RepID=A0A1W6JV22_9CAUD|nr:tail length tape measure protein [Vibrio phage pVco-5]ARM71107.1 hypothetical protein pVco5_118 [Vibrio phage pVco-5]
MSQEDNTQVQEPVDIFAMDSEQFEKFDVSTLGSDESVDEADSNLDTDEVDDVDSSEQEEDEYIDVEGLDDELELGEEDESDVPEQEEVSETDEESEESDDTSDEPEIDYAAEYQKLIGEPLRANGKDIPIKSADEARKLMQLGAGYYKNMEALKPARKVIAMLEDNDMMDEEKLSFAIDLLNKNPQAINKLISDQDLSEIVDEKNEGYTPTNKSVSEQALNVKDALKAIEHTETYEKTVNVLGREWDTQSREIVQKSPEAIAMINEHMSNGIYDAVSAEVERRKMFGTIPEGTPDILAYKQVGDEMYAGQAQTAPKGQQADALKANANVPPIRKPKAETNKTKRTTTKPRGKANVTQQMEDVFAMSSEEFKRKYG